MLKFLGLCLVLPKIQKNSGLDGVVKALWVFFFDLLTPKLRMQNGNYFAKKFGWCLVPF
jgi:hypothetical protein